ncbi:diguanylate cyclase [Chromobacterium sp. ATCC 53434]|uniref:sensor domain-containing diguanylate cyclase n=1 Tax=Chromobacterium sp. (strain ATCC 53434 / SC 14030) TaxID=2059672 RepID=UPI000C76E8FF|nr:sensor domain-containing diguanylate cyclase [Chromobacterium sp. ATCC 53434]AUH51779.1 diguanylate cyclase [Chromobacterium sp. ATCC 53434]
MDAVLSQLSLSLSAARTVDQLIRPLLEMLGNITGMESTYLTSIELDLCLQHVRYARNIGDMQIPEGLSVPWEDTLCKRSLDMGLTATNEVETLWGDSEAARQLGIKTYLSAPVRDTEGGLLGTLCAASSRKLPMQPETETLLQLFANIVANFIERETLVQNLQSANAQLAAFALTDTLTGLPNRRALFDELERMLAQAERCSGSILVGGIDLDGFKQVNDGFGHQAGDDFLKAVSGRLQTALRGGDMLGRVGGDEFVVIGLGPAWSHAGMPGELITDGEPAVAARELQQRLAQASIGDYMLDGQILSYGGASVGVVALAPFGMQSAAAIKLADREMYAVKLARKRRG